MDKFLYPIILSLFLFSCSTLNNSKIVVENTNRIKTIEEKVAKLENEIKVQQKEFETRIDEINEKCNTNIEFLSENIMKSENFNYNFKKIKDNIIKLIEEANEKWTTNIEFLSKNIEDIQYIKDEIEHLKKNSKKDK